MEFDNCKPERRSAGRFVECSPNMHPRRLWRQCDRSNNVVSPKTNAFGMVVVPNRDDRQSASLADVEENKLSSMLSSQSAQEDEFTEIDLVRFEPTRLNSVKNLHDLDGDDPSKDSSNEIHLFNRTNHLTPHTDRSEQRLSKKDNHRVTCQPNLSRNLKSGMLQTIASRNPRSKFNITSDLPRRFFAILIINAILNHLSNHQIHLDMTNDKQQYRLHLTSLFPSVLSASATTLEINAECRRDNDCDDMRCYQGKCICPKDRPIEDKGVCLPLSVVGEVCSVSEQCLGNSVCLDNFCSCAIDTISLFNPSSKIYYCHPKRRLREECSHDAQCPSNSFCSTNKCLCQNGYGSVTVKSLDGAETAECLPKICSHTKECESLYHICEDNRCICLADHFDPHTAECYEFGSTGGKLSGNQTDKGKSTKPVDNKPDSSKTLEDLIYNSDKLWFVILILVVLVIILLGLIIKYLRKCFLAYCWTAHKKEYEPNNESAPKSGYFNKNSINNKSFRQKSGDIDDDGDDDDDDGNDNDDTAAAKSNLVTNVKKSRNALLNNGNQRQANNGEFAALAENRYVKVDMRAASAIDEDQQQTCVQADSTEVHYQPYHLMSRPLATSNSTAV